MKMESDFKKTRLEQLAEASTRAWEEHRREEREWEAEQARKRAEKRAQRRASTPAATPDNEPPSGRPTDMRTVAPLAQLFCSELVIGTLIID